MSQSQFFDSSKPYLVGSEREKVIRKIKSCLALTASSNANESETALRQAQSLMRKYKLNEVDVEAESVGAEVRNTRLKRMSNWQRMLGNVCARAFGCQLIMQRQAVFGRYGPTEFIFIGVMPSAELAAYAYDSLLRQLTLARQKYSKEHQATRKLADDFCFAWVNSVIEKVSNFAAENPTQSADEKNALLVIESREEAAINAWIERSFGEVKERPKPPVRVVDPLAYQQGLAAGAEANIHQAVHGQREGQLRIA